MSHTSIRFLPFFGVELRFTLVAGLAQNDHVCFGFAARRKLLERARRAGLGGFKRRSGTEASVKEMWDGEEGKLIHHRVTPSFMVQTFSINITLIKTLFIST